MATHYEHAHYMTKWRIRHTLFINVPYTHPPLRNCRDNTKLAYHGPAHYMRTKVRGPESLELALEMRKKESYTLSGRKKNLNHLCNSQRIWEHAYFFLHGMQNGSKLEF